MSEMEKNVDSMLNNDDISCNDPSPDGGASRDILRSNSFAFRAPQENFCIEDFDLGKIYGVGSYSKVSLISLGFFSLILFIYAFILALLV